MPTLTIFRGLPGSGKSTIAAALAKKTGALVLEPDALLVVDGVYTYTECRWHEAVSACLRVLASVGLDGMGSDVIYADVLFKRAQVDSVIHQYQKNKDYPHTVRIFSLATTADDALLTNRHHVREEDIRRMERDWEAYPGEVVI